MASRPSATPTDGISVRPVTDTEHRLVHGAMIEVWQDTNDLIDETFEEWAQWHVGGRSYDPSLWFLAFADGELAAFSICRQDPIDPKAGYVGMLGVRTAWRRQGLGEALLLHSFAEFRRGYTRGRSAWTHRASPARPGCTSVRA